MTRTLAVVPARAGSKRVPGKNVRDFLGRPLIAWSIDFALAVPAFDEVVVSTDSQAIADLSSGMGARVPGLRGEELASDTATTVDVLLDLLGRLEASGERFDRVAVLQPTTPVRFAARWSEAASLLDHGAPAAVGVVAVAHHPYWTYLVAPDGELEPCFPNRADLRSQALPPAVQPNGALYLTNVAALRASGSLVPPGTRAVTCTDAVESVDIDTEEDLVEAMSIVEAWLAAEDGSALGGSAHG
jgi:CMP-N,N'-diacetyllegionaminic acid synthase